MTEQPSRALVAVLVLLVAWSAIANASWEYALADRVPDFERAVPLVPGNDIGFASGRAGSEALYGFHAFRYALAPRVATRQRLDPRSEWIVSDRAGVLPGYRVVHRLGDGLLVLRRRQSR